MMSNRGTGAGGANTNKNGKAFEETTSHLPYLLANHKNGMKHTIPGKKGKYDSFYEWPMKDKGKVTYLSQGGLKSYFAWKFGIEMIRHPDEAYLIRRGGHYVLRVLEKKNQNVEGSVDTKLLAGPMIQEEYAMCVQSTDTLMRSLSVLGVQEKQQEEQKECKEQEFKEQKECKEQECKEEQKEQKDDKGFESLRIEYAFCLSNFLKESYCSDGKKWVLLRAINEKYGIRVFFGEDEDYHERLQAWIES